MTPREGGSRIGKGGAMKTRIPLIAALVLTGCATTYQPSGFTGGFSETRLAPDRFIVSFSGNAFTAGEQARDFALLRAAELSRDGGYRYFTVLDSERTTETSYYRSPTTTDASAYGMGNSVYGTATTYGGDITPINKPGITLSVVCFTEPRDGALDADFIIPAIRSKYGMK